MFFWRPFSLLNSYEKGLRAESYAVWYLRLKGYKIFARRYKTASGEVDIIAKRGRLLVLVEVKARKDLTDGLNAITLKSAKRMVSAARHWLYRRKNIDKFTLRFDVIVICPKKLPIHIQNYIKL